MSDKMLQRTVMDELAWDPSINSAHIGVAASDGVVTLTGKVDSYAAKSAAERVTGRLFGVKAVVEQLDVKYAGDTSPDDGEIASYALRVLSWDVDVPRNSVLVKVEKGWVTLTGELDWNYQRTAAERDVRKLYGVKGVTNQIKIKSRVASADVREKIKAASQTPGPGSPRLEYDMSLFTTGPVKVWAYLSPRNNVLPSDGLKYAISIDGATPQVVNVTKATGANDTTMNRQWERNTSDNVNRTVTTHVVGRPGAHTLKVWMVDPTVVVQKLVVDTGGVRPSYLGPPESLRAGRNR